ncbi:MAG: hypothetical protein PHO02_02095 [Candidatus Nanoarchaeia archaeon]|nr:hypothetical protein [Candidatus Nanoarchaeia archaeon]
MKKQSIYKINGKKGQTEDLFADLIISIIIIAITMGIIALSEFNQKKEIEPKQMNDMAGLYMLDAMTLVRTPILDSYLRDSAWFEKSIPVNVGEMLGIIADGNKELYPWVFSQPPFGTDAGFAKTSDSTKCTKNFYDFLESRLPFVWQIAMYDDTGKEVFICTPRYEHAKIIEKRQRNPELFVEGGFRGCEISDIKLPTDSGKTVTLEVGLCP